MFIQSVASKGRHRQTASQLCQPCHMRGEVEKEAETKIKEKGKGREDKKERREKIKTGDPLAEYMA